MFCNQCGSQVEDGKSFCPNCGTQLKKPEPVMSERTNFSQDAFVGFNQMDMNQKLIIANALTIISLVFGGLGGILFGVIPALIGIASGVVGLLMAIDLRKLSGGAMGTAAFVMGIVGVSLSGLFFISCICYGNCFGWVGVACRINREMDDIREGISDLFDSYY